ncbi:patatin-like phospholipase family protein [Myxococcus stipitatus DSM 14675]|uniref:Patatin-like phospholipase family protein n=1 Tax=Myxococcus stipitatus (strain DSM 14675 / JCM 12634 / Mx s8) TaxID=1278073 RepID=L7U819_MYXSD|nr:patatin-like phospholipase family protein [Myxococcus stipitatus]AGC42639.1 patatin-like phospholipase family protein [Myxococcus stipitatus DSM 14675]
MNPSRTYLLCLAAMAALSSGCFLRTGYVLEALNAPSEPKTPPLPISVRERVARLTRSHLMDAYADPAAVARWMSAMGSAPQPVVEQLECLRANAGGSNATCYDSFLKKTLGGGTWGLPAAPSTVDASAPTAAEVDAQRFLANALGIASSLVALGDSLSDPLNPHHVTQGLREGAESTAQYISARRWSRKLGRPSNAVVLSGGGANGAFSAGAMWRLLGILESCRGKAAPEGCGDARIDLAAGTSTGALISTLVDLFHTPGQEQKARDVLIDNYTCSVESDLYCVNSTWVWRIASDLKGLVRFDGIQDKLRAAVVPAQLTNGTELVAVSVDFNTGDVHGISDQDPATFPPTATDAQKVDGLINAVLASIVEPVLAEPVPWVPSREGKLEGTFLDGGVRSGLPLLQAVQRGAERVLILSTRGLQTEPSPPPENAVSTLMRTIDLFVAQPFVGEVQQAELAAVGRRFAEYNVCTLRLAQVEDASAVPAYCQRTGQGFVPVEPKSLRAATSMWMGPAHFAQVASSWRAAWMFRPESALATASGYSFSPKVMRPLFKDGVKTLQQRCSEVLRLFEIHGTLAQEECARSVDEVVQEAESLFAPEGQCTGGKPSQRSCD